MLGSVSLRRSQRWKHVQSNEAMASTIEQEEDIVVFHRRQRKQTRSANTFQKQNEIVIDGLVNHPIWRGSICVPNELGKVDGVAAYMSSRTNLQVSNAVHHLPNLLKAQALSRKDVWPAAFHNCFPTADIIDLYILPTDERSEKALDTLLSDISDKDVALRVVHSGVSMLIFSSFQLQYAYWKTTSGKYYLWGVLERPDSIFTYRQEGNGSARATDELQDVAEYETKVNSNSNTQAERERIRVNTLETEAANCPNGRGANLDQQESCRNTADLIMPRIGTNPDVPACSESIGPSVLEMVNNFDKDEVCGDEISSTYSVHPRYARTLGSILAKHGDITRDCWIKCSKTLTSALEKICETVEDLGSMRFVDLRRNHLSSMLSVITDAEQMKIEVKWLRERYEDLMEAIEQLREYRKLKDKRKVLDATVEAKKTAISLKRDEILKLWSEIEMMENEVVQLTEERKRVCNGVRDISSKCSYFCHNSLMDGIL